MPPDPLLLADDEDEQYASEEDSDFAPDEGGAAGDAVEPDEDDDSDVAADGAGEAGSKKRKRETTGPAADGDADFENSGDEAVIKKGKKKRRKKAKTKDGEGAADAAAGAADEDGDEDEGPLIKTRSMKAVEKAERKHKTVSGPVTVDVNALWASMISTPIIPNASLKAPAEDPSAAHQAKDQDKENTGPGKGKGKDGEEDTITIKRAYNFAGKVHTETKVVARDSAEARLWLASQKKEGTSTATDPEAADDNPSATPARKIRRAFRSAFEPLVSLGGGATVGAGRSDLNLGLANLLRQREENAKAEAKKMNTVQKSKLDWAQHVDQEGMREELELAGRKKGNFGDTQEFLSRVEGRRDNDERRVRLAGKA
ncbi:bucentaur or craniofacial development-domain-containing protein [Zalerion maritima]|uniref:SWR1-complex protein 5 n=1 Tax=Zalerion maritima TaxID=339359 RepID=A0AAD5RZR1_9PEZI|nr:bucentaur or craniofacial development-domain-containing protein [Zalerion maritima]